MKSFEDLTPAARIGGLTAVCALFLAFAWTSRFATGPATVACTALLVVVALAAPRLGILLVVFCTPIRSIFDLPKESMQIVLAAGMAAVTLRHLALFPAFLRRRQPRLLVVLAAFIAVYALRGGLELLQHPEIGLRTVAQEGAFYVAMLGVALAAHTRATERGFASMLLASAGMVIGLTMAVDIVNTYFPVLDDYLGLLSHGFPGERFSGLHVNPNATGKYLLLGTFLAAGVLAATRRPAIAGAAVVGLIATTLCFSATFSKSTVLAGTVALLAWLAATAWQRDWPRATRILGTVVLMLGTAGLWYLAIAPYAERLELRNLLEFKKLGTATVDRPAAPTTLARRFEDEMRIGRSFSMTVEKPAAKAPAPAETNRKTTPDKPAADGSTNSEMYRNVPGRIVYSKRDCGWECTGQRDRLWGAGLAIVGEHWLIGIGPHRWMAEYQARLGFPFDTPHDALLELWGGYGLAGVALYLALLVLLVRQLVRSVALPASAPAVILVTTTALYIVAMLVAELVDPAKFLAMNPHAIWLWTFAAAAAAGLEAS
jgi:hypothetical protein